MLSPIILAGQRVRLEPLAREHAEALAAAAAEDRSSYGFTRVPDGPAAAAAYVRTALDDHTAGIALPWAVRRRSDDRIVGSTRFLDLALFAPTTRWQPVGAMPTDDTPPTVLEIGSTWYAASAQRTGVNAETKLLLLTYAFERWRALRVCLKTDARNARSRQAIERLGARFEGVRRAHMLGSDGTVRDSAYYSIVAAEWPAVAAGLRARLR